MRNMDLFFIFTGFCLESPGSRVLAFRCAKALDSAAKLGAAVSQDWGEAWQNSMRADNMIYAAKLARCKTENSEISGGEMDLIDAHHYIIIINLITTTGHWVLSTCILQSAVWAFAVCGSTKATLADVT